MGNISLYSTKATSIITPYTLAGDFQSESAMKKVTNMALILQNLDNNRSDDILDVSNFKEHHFDNLDLNDSTTNTEIKLNTLLSDSSIRPYLDSNDTSLIDSSTALDHMNTNINTHGKVNTYSSNFRSKGESKDSEELHYIVNAWAPQGHEFQAHNQYRAMATYNKNIYV
ncbi:MAG: hypothetical protein U9O86_00745, partial [Campylobacterota bacterium]|nr:hypothetical protein [Campylobacterota bacterium]